MKTANRENQRTQSKILFATNISGLGGGETSLLNLLSTLKENGFQPTLVCPPGLLHNRASQLGITTINIIFPPVRMLIGLVPIFSVLTILKLIFFIKKNKFDIVHVETPLSFYYLGTAAWMANTPCVATYHGYWQLKSGLARLMMKHFCSRLYPVSKTTALDIYETGLLPADKVRIIPLSFNEKFSYKLPSRQESRIPFGLPVDVPIVMQIARFQPIKGQMILLEALAHLVQLQNGSIPLVVFVGDILDATHNDAILYKKLVEERAKREDLQNHVRFLGWQDDVPQLMRAADIVVIPSDYETFSMTTIEAMAVGTLVIATSSGGPAEIIQNEITGVLIPPKNPLILAEAIHISLSDPSRSEEIASKAKEFVALNYSPKTRYNLLVKEYLEVLSSKTNGEII